MNNSGKPVGQPKLLTQRQRRTNLSLPIVDSLTPLHQQCDPAVSFHFANPVDFDGRANLWTAS